MNDTQHYGRPAFQWLARTWVFLMLCRCVSLGKHMPDHLSNLRAGIAHNKILAKLASGMHKPSQQTVVTLDCVPGLMADLPIPKLRQLGGKFGEEIMAALGITSVGARAVSLLVQLLLQAAACL